MPTERSVAIEVRGLGKMYRIYDRPPDRLKQMLFARFGHSYGQEFWALRDVSFTIRRGESVGVIGRNGSGKSTLLQMLAGTLAPTTGALLVSGRVAALLELGSGFNMEFSGRENVFLNGAILGVGRDEMEARYEEIVAFADIGEFIEQPVKTYSSGMVVRLAFAVQAIVQKDILIVDEALAVGDEAFQRKCMRKLEEFREQGGTVLLVSHSVEAIVRQCTRALWIHQGRLQLDGPSKSVTDIYQRFIYGTQQQQQQTLDVVQAHGPSALDGIFGALGAPQEATIDDSPTPAPPVSAMYDSDLSKAPELVYGTGEADIVECGLFDQAGALVNVIVVGQRVAWRMRVRFNVDARNLNFGMSIRLIDGVYVAGINTWWEGQRFALFPAGAVVDISFDISMNTTPGTYYVETGVIGDTALGGGETNFLHRRIDVASFRVIPPDGRTISGIAHLEPMIRVTSAAAE